MHKSYAYTCMFRKYKWAVYYEVCTVARHPPSQVLDDLRRIFCASDFINYVLTGSVRACMPLNAADSSPRSISIRTAHETR